MVASSLKFSFSLFSDTAMVCTYCSEEIISIIPDQETRELVTGFLLLELCSEVVELIYKFGLFSDPILINRGAISVGQVAVWKDVVIGPAVDEAASLMDIADGGIVIFSENCRKYEAYRHDFQDASVRAHEVQGLRDAAPELIKNSMVIRDYPVPLKIGKELSMNVLKIHAIQEEALPGVLEKLNNKMTSNDPSILLKKRNTLSYLNFCWGIAID